MNRSSSKFVVATPARSVCDENARALEQINQLRFIALGTRRGTAGVSPEHTRLNPWIGFCAYIAAKTLRPFAAESFRVRFLPWFDRWVLEQLRPGDHIISSYGYVNECFKWIRGHGGKTFLDAGNSHPENFWQTISEEHRRWNCRYPPIPPQWHRRSMSMLEDVDLVLSPSSFVTRSFLERGFKREQILGNVYPIDLACFQPANGERPSGRPLTVISTGSLSLRKGTPYLLEAFRIVRKSIANARLLLTQLVQDSVKDIVPKYLDLEIEWSPSLPHPELANRLRNADIFVLPSLEDGFARTVAEALACGLPVITTPNTGASDLIRSGENGEVVPIRDPRAIADAVLRWWERIRAGSDAAIQFDKTVLDFQHFENEFLSQLRERALISATEMSDTAINRIG